MILFVVTVPNVMAQTTSITNLQSPAGATVGKDVVVTIAVTYNLGASGFTLGVAIFDLDTGWYAQGTVQSTENNCIAAVRTGNIAFCEYFVSASGSDTVTFNLQLSTAKSYALLATALLGDSSGNPILDSLSTRDFRITVASDKFSLAITVPSQVSASIDGATQSAGIVQAGLSQGSHVISVPDTVDTKTPGVRLRFDHWNDGYVLPTRTVNLQADSTFEAMYVTQYSLTLSTPYGNAAGVGWYDKYSSAQISTPASQPMSGVLGSLGGKWTFQGWYEGQTMVSTSSSTTITMNNPRSLTAHWTGDYLMPAIIIGVPIAVALIAAVFLAPRKKGERRPKRKKRRSQRKRGKK